MPTFYVVSGLIALFLSQFTFACDSPSHTGDLSSKHCEAIASACTKAGFNYVGGEGKEFWMDCMKPVLLNKAVSGVSIDAKDVKMCREFKIVKMKKELKQFENVK